MSKDDRELIARLRAKRPMTVSYAYGIEGGGFINPDGPAAATRLEALQAQPVGEAQKLPLCELLADVELTLQHARTFITSRQKMHPDGVSLYDEEIAKVGAALNALAALTASPPVVEREAGITAELLGEVMQDAWGEICDDAGAHPEDIRRDGRKTFYDPRHWTDLIALRLNERLAKADAILALTPVEGVGERALRDAVVDLLAIVKGDLSGPTQVSGVISEAEAVLAALSTPAAQGDEVREALDDAVSTLAAVRATTINDEEWHASRLHFRDLCGQTIARMNTVLATLTKGARDAG